MNPSILSKGAALLGYNQPLRIKAFKGGKYTDEVGTFPAMFNPDSVRISYQKSADGIGRLSVSSEVSMTLIFSRTGVEPLHGGNVESVAYANLPIAGAVGALLLPGIAGDVNYFLRMTMQPLKESHEPAFLKLEWGETLKKMNDKKLTTSKRRIFFLFYDIGASAYECKMKSVDVHYTLFDRKGNPLRAELDCVFAGDGDVPEMQSPDVTHSRAAKADDNLPNMASNIYEDPSYYMKVAEANQLDSVRNISAGKTIVFPPVK